MTKPRLVKVRALFYVFQYITKQRGCANFDTASWLVMVWLLYFFAGKMSCFPTLKCLDQEPQCIGFHFNGFACAEGCASSTATTFGFCLNLYHMFRNLSSRRAAFARIKVRSCQLHPKK